MFHGLACYLWMGKLKSLKPVLKAWNWEVFGDVELRKEALSHIFGWDDLEYACPFTLIELGEREEVRGDLKNGTCLKRFLGDKSKGECD